jgi:muramoyltetrapeptide carboxypeptidase LdcA involved in peptidoglycan recycling
LTNVYPNNKKNNNNNNNKKKNNKVKSKPLELRSRVKIPIFYDMGDGHFLPQIMTLVCKIEIL